MTAKKGKVVFKPYNPNQLSALPPSLNELIEGNHPVRIVNQIIDKIDLDPLLASYQGGGTSSYHPRMMLKILVYSYLSNVYSSRKMEVALKENINFMWLSGMNKPDHNTLNRFRTEKLQGILKKVFAQVVMLLAQEGHVSLKDVYTDGTKIEANANRYTFVWGNSIKTQKEKMVKQLEELWAYTEGVAKEELKDIEKVEFNQISPEKVADTISKIDQALAGKEVDKKVKQKIQYIKKNWPENLKKYDEQEKVLAGRNSYSKTDNDASFMRLKDDHMNNGQLKPAYNLQLSTCNQFILCYSLHQTSTDYTTLIPHLQLFKELYNTLPETITADAGYGCEENYEFIEKNQIGNYVKYNYFYKDMKEGIKNEDFKYQEDTDSYTCPSGQQLKLIRERKRITTTGYEQKASQYQASNCLNCPLKNTCSPDHPNKRIELSRKLEAYKEKARYNLLTEKGLAHRRQRNIDVEPTFAHIKHNGNFKRFLTKGIKNVEIETGLKAIAHNLKKIAA